MNTLNENSKLPWIMLVISFYIMGNYSTSFNVLPPILPLIISEFSLTYTQAGILQGVFNLPGAIIGIITGIIASRFGIRRIGIFATLLMFLGNIVFLISGNYLGFVLGRLLTGVGGATVTVVVLTGVTQWFKTKNLGLAFGILTVSYPGFSILSYVLYSNLAVLGGWQIPLQVSTIFAGIAFFSFTLIFREKPSNPDAIPPPGTSPRTISLRSCIIQTCKIAGLFYLGMFFFQITESLFVTFSPDHFYREGLTLPQASLLTSIWMMGSLLFSIPFGRLVDKYGHADHLIIIGQFLGAIGVGLLVIAPLELYFIIVPIISFSIAPCWALLLRQNADYIPKELTEYGSGIFSSVAEIALLIGPIIAGTIIDTYGSVQIIFYLMIITLVLSASLHYLGTKKFT